MCNYTHTLTVPSHKTHPYIHTTALQHYNIHVNDVFTYMYMLRDTGANKLNIMSI